MWIFYSKILLLISTVKFNNKILQHFSTGVFYNIFLHLFSTNISRQHLQQIFRQHLLQVFSTNFSDPIFFIFFSSEISSQLLIQNKSTNITSHEQLCKFMHTYTCTRIIMCIYVCLLFISDINVYLIYVYVYFYILCAWFNNYIYHYTCTHTGRLFLLMCVYR